MAKKELVTKEQIIEKLKTIIDPELNVNIVDLGLIYEVEIKPSKEILKPASPVFDVASQRGEQVQDDKKRVQDDTKRGDEGKENKKWLDVTIKMTLTTPGCPLSYVFEAWIPEAVKKIKGVKNVYINLVWEPAWDPDKMSEEAKESLGIIK